MQGLFPLFFVFIFLSSSNLPRHLLKTGWFHTVATWNPISYLIEGFRSLYIFGWDGTALLRGFGVAIGLLVVGLLAVAGRHAHKAAADMTSNAPELSRRLSSTRSVAQQPVGRRLRDRVARRAHLPAPARSRRPLARLPADLPRRASPAASPPWARCPAFDFPAGYTAFQFVFVLLQAAMFAGLFTGFTLAFDFESGFARRLMLAAGNRRGIVLGYALVALTRAAITLAVVTAVALLAGMRITGDGVDIFGLYGLAALLVLVGYGWAAGVAFRFRSIQAGPLMQTPVFLILFLAPVYVPLPPAQRLDPRRRGVNPATAFLDAGRGLISGVHNHTALAFACAAGADRPVLRSGRSPGCARPSASRRAPSSPPHPCSAQFVDQRDLR